MSFLSNCSELERFISIVRLPDKVSSEKARELMEALSDSSRRVRAAAALKLGTSQCKDAIHDLILMLQNDPDAETRGMAALALGEIKSPQATCALTKALEDAESSEERRLILHSLRDIADISASPSIVPFLHHPDAETRLAAAAALVALDDEHVLPALDDLENDPRIPESCKAYISELRAEWLKRRQDHGKGILQQQASGDDDGLRRDERV